MVIQLRSPLTSQDSHASSGRTCRSLLPIHKLMLLQRWIGIGEGKAQNIGREQLARLARFSAERAEIVTSIGGRQRVRVSNANAVDGSFPNKE